MKTPISICVALFAAAMTTGLSQGPGSRQGKDKSKGQPLPLQGKELPEVTAFDENGDPFPLRQKLKGRHGVIVFGCLT